MSRIAVIGGGIAGLAAALRARKKGYEVDIYEKNDALGGKIDEFIFDGYRFDTGPSLLTLPELVEDLFSLFGKSASDYIEFLRLPLINKYFFEDGLVLNAFQDVDDFSQELAAKTDISKLDVLDFLKKSEEIFTLSAETFLFNSLHKSSTYFNKRILILFAKIWSIDPFRSMHSSLKKRFKDPHVLQMMMRFATYNGSNPYKAPATLNVIPYLEHCKGAYFPTKGMYGLILALEKLAREEGINIYLNQEVDRILLKKKSIMGILTDARKQYDKIITDIDIHRVYSQLLDKRMPSIYADREKSSSALIFYWGINRVFKEMEIHNILFTKDYMAEFKNLFDSKGFFNDPTVYIYISAKMKKDDAPEGCENWFVMINVPNNIGQDWKQLREKFRETIIQKLNRMLKVDMKKYIVSEKVLDPVLIEKNTSSLQGALYGNSSNNLFSAFLRHPNYSKNIQNLFFCGGSVHPGGGIPLCLASAKIVDDMLPEV